MQHNQQMRRSGPTSVDLSDVTACPDLVTHILRCGEFDLFTLARISCVCRLWNWTVALTADLVRTAASRTAPLTTTAFRAFFALTTHRAMSYPYVERRRRVDNMPYRLFGPDAFALVLADERPTAPCFAHRVHKGLEKCAGEAYDYGIRGWLSRVIIRRNTRLDQQRAARRPTPYRRANTTRPYRTTVPAGTGCERGEV